MHLRVVPIYTEKGPVMAAQVFAPVVRRPHPAIIEITGFCDSSRTSTAEHLPSKCVIEMESKASAAGLGCVRGTTIALVFEAVAGLFIYGFWELCHLLLKAL
jgi:hypothetical protein